MSRQRALLRFRLVPVAVAYLAERRIDARPLLERLGLADAPRAEPVFLPLAKVGSFLDGCARLGDEPLFGWNLATRMSLGMYGLVEFAMRTSDTLHGGIDSVCRYGSLVNGLYAFDVETRDATVGFGFTIPGERDAGGVQLNEYTIHYMVRLVAAFAAAPQSIDLAHRRPRGADELVARAGVPIRFGAPSCRVWLPRDALDSRSTLSDPGLHGFLTDQLMSAFAADAADDVVRAVHDMLALRIGRSSLDVGDVARALTTSPRTLQRRLRDAGTSYRDVLDLVRHQRARELVLVGALSIAEIAARVGYDDAAVFARAFRRWTGQSPSDHRRRP